MMKAKGWVLLLVGLGCYLVAHNPHDVAAYARYRGEEALADRHYTADDMIQFSTRTKGTDFGLFTVFYTPGEGVGIGILSRYLEL